MTARMVVATTQVGQEPPRKAGAAFKPATVVRFRLHGLRKLNWAERAGLSYEDHLVALGLDDWLEPGPIAVVVGPNAGGKSTLIDLFRALSDPSIWPGLARENYPGDDFSGFDVAGENFTLSVRFSKYTPQASETFDKLTILALAEGPGGQRQATVTAPKYELEGAWLNPLQDVLDVCGLPPVRYLAPFGDYPASELTDEALVAFLNALSAHFPSVLSNPHVAPFKRFRGQAARDGRIGVLFKDDPGQHAFVHRRALPLGWLQLVSVLAFLGRCETGSLIVLDEPVQLHGALGYSQDTPLAAWYTQVRRQRLVDGPDEVHRWTVGRNVIKAFKETGTTASMAGGDMI